jgi:hypothetical protein
MMRKIKERRERWHSFVVSRFLTHSLQGEGENMQKSLFIFWGQNLNSDFARILMQPASGVADGRHSSQPASRPFAKK